MIKAETVKNLKDIQLSKEGRKTRWMDRCYKLALYDGISMEFLLNKINVKRYLVYGFNEFAKILICCSKRENHECLGIIDRNAENIEVSMPIYRLDNTPGDLLDSVDAIIVCVIMENARLIKDIEDTSKKRVIKFEDLIYEL